MPQKLPTGPRHDIFRERVFCTRLGRFHVRRFPEELLRFEGPQDVNRGDGERDFVDAEHGGVGQHANVLRGFTTMESVSFRQVRPTFAGNRNPLLPCQDQVQDP